MIILGACDKDSSETHSRTINPQTKEEFDKEVKDFESEVTKNIFPRWFWACDDSDAECEQAKWLEDENML